ncbi:hypothetical protein IV203_027688 [Nitzschia inconspicua]|uniref:Uncharacterized protein n=1 Tax=Nitzschia inconspicua TaxID=303405 RepID=A0A9K3Q3K1_9STRA|nr:hypothetical protein IV203_027680 [Nitzschia inconspicua]KAG7369938.1 hypothetical protein IV203_027684 [Nitzschia inconspicua]KAG7369942.1 hypothetical protein IV203_027688 [Nitzschia inconspicua]
MARTATATTPTTPFHNLMLLIGCNAQTIAEMENYDIKQLEDLCSLKEESLATICKEIRRLKFPFPVPAEGRLKLLLSEVHIRRYANVPLDTIWDPAMDAEGAEAMFLNWESRDSEFSSFQSPTDGAPDAHTLSKDWTKGFRILENWIGRHVDTKTGVPLAFAVRQEPPDSSEYEAKNYSSLFEELKKRATLHDADVKTNSWARSVKTKVWTILDAIFEGHPAYVHIQPFFDKLDGPAAYKALQDQCLGLNNISHVAAEIDRGFAKLVYTQETKRWNFDRYVDAHVDLYQRIQELVPFGISGMDGNTRSSSSIPEFAGSAKVVAVSAPAGKRKQRGHAPKTKRQKGSNGRISSVEIEDRYYTFQEYRQLSPEDRKRLKELRMKRNGKGGGSRKNSQKQAKDIVEAIVNAITGTSETASDDETDPPKSTANDDPATVTNRNNPALTRQHSKPKSKKT